MKTNLKSPIYYMGNKYKLIEELKEKFPAKINVFYDVFGGSGTVALNMVQRSKIVVYNEFNKWVAQQFEFFHKTHPNTINEQIKMLALEHDLPINTNDNHFNALKLAEYKKNYEKMVEYYLTNNRVSPLIHTFIKQYSFCNMLDFDDLGFKKESFGNRFYKEDIMLKNMYAVYMKPISIKCGSFEDLMNFDFNGDDFLYFDPPYWNTGANYNDGWTKELDDKLLAWLDELTKRGIKWAYSNVSHHKNRVNNHLIEWYTKNNYNVFNPKIEYSVGGNSAEDNNTTEILVLNYDPVGIGSYTEQLTLEL